MQWFIEVVAATQGDPNLSFILTSHLFVLVKESKIFYSKIQ